MEERSLESLTRQAAGIISRRASLLTLGAAGLAALASPLAADAKNKKKGGKNKKKSKKQAAPPLDVCGPQVEECTIFFGTLCGGDPNCQDSVACCSSLATCDFAGFGACLAISAEN